MPEFAIPNNEGERAHDISALKASIISNEVSLFELLRSAPTGDYWAHVQSARLFHALSGELGVLEKLVEELRSRIVELGGNHNDNMIESELARKDGHRRLLKLQSERSRAFDNQPSLLSGDTFETCLEQYKALIAYVEKLWADACQLYKLANYPLATFVS